MNKIFAKVLIIIVEFWVNKIYSKYFLICCTISLILFFSCLLCFIAKSPAPRFISFHNGILIFPIFTGIKQIFFCQNVFFKKSSFRASYSSIFSVGGDYTKAWKPEIKKHWGSSWSLVDATAVCLIPLLKNCHHFLMLGYGIPTQNTTNFHSSISVL